MLLFLCFSGSSQSSASPNLPSRTSSATSCPSTVHRDSGSDIESLLNADPGYDSVFRKVRLPAVSLSHIPLLKINVEVFMKNTHCNCNCVYMRVAEWWLKLLLKQITINQSKTDRKCINFDLGMNSGFRNFHKILCKLQHKNPVHSLQTARVYCVFAPAACPIGIIQYIWSSCFVSLCLAFYLSAACGWDAKHLLSIFFKPAALHCCRGSASSGPCCHSADVESLFEARRPLVKVEILSISFCCIEQLKNGYGNVNRMSFLL